MAYRIPIHSQTKREAAIEFRRKVVVEYERWYRGEVDSLFGTPAPTPNERRSAASIRESAILTWAAQHQEPKYRRILRLASTELAGQTILDLGSGGIPSGLAFTGCRLICVDPLVSTFRELGYPLARHAPRARFVAASAEKLPLRSGSVDGIISVNAIDHFDDLGSVSVEMQRVLKRSGLIRLHVHYHEPSVLEPLALNDEVMRREFAWHPHFRRVGEWREPGDRSGERHVLWGG